MKKIAGILILILFTISLNAEEKGNIVYHNEGFQINTLEASPAANGHQILMMFLPVDEGYTPNVNVMTQNYDGTLADYKKLTESQFKQMNLRTIINKIEDDTYTIEYAGILQNQDLHFYAIAYKKDHLVYLATGTTARAKWKKYKDQIISVVESFHLSD